MLVKTGSVTYLGAKKGLLSKSQKPYCLYNIFDIESSESMQLFGSNDSLDFNVAPMENVIAVIDIRGNFKELKQLIPASQAE